MNNNGESMEFNCIKNNKENKGIYKAFNFNNRIKKEIFNLFKKKIFSNIQNNDDINSYIIFY